MKWSLRFISPFVLSLFSLVHRAPPAEASHLVLQMRFPGVKWLCRHLSSEGRVRSLCARHCDSRWRPGGCVQRCWPSTKIWSHRQHTWACSVRTHPSPSWQESHTAVPGVLLCESLSSVSHSMDKPYRTEGLPRWLSGREPACQCRRLSLISGSGRSPGAEIGKPLHYSCLGNPIDRGVW